MSDLLIRLRDARGKPLGDVADVTVTAHRTGEAVASKKGAKGSTAIKVPGLTALQVYVVRVFPMRHRPVARFVLMPPSGTRTVELACPVDPKRVREVEFPPYASLSARARLVLEGSELEHPPQNVSGPELYQSDELSDVARAGLCNLLAKMERTGLPDGKTVLDHVLSLYRIRGDRVFANVTNGLRDLVKTAVDDGTFRLVDGSLHTPPPGFARAGSFKTDDRYGNLQVTFFSSVGAPLQFKADIDIDDAAGIEHVFQVIGHWASGQETHPFDIHEILLHHQGLDPGYVLVT